MAITFPDNPTEGQELTWGDYVYRYTRGKWIGVSYTPDDGG